MDDICADCGREYDDIGLCKCTAPYGCVSECVAEPYPHRHLTLYKVLEGGSVYVENAGVWKPTTPPDFSLLSQTGGVCVYYAAATPTASYFITNEPTSTDKGAK